MPHPDGFRHTWAIFAIAPRHDDAVDDQLEARGIVLVRAADGSVFEAQACDDVGAIDDDEACARARRAGFRIVRVPDSPRSRYASMLVVEPWPEDPRLGPYPGAGMCEVAER